MRLQKTLENKHGHVLFSQTQNPGKQACLIVPSREELIYTQTQKSTEMFTVTTPAIASEMFCHYYSIFSPL